MLFPTPRLPASMPMELGELFSSWVIRLAAAHGMKTRSLCSLVLGEPVEFTTDLNGPRGDKLLVKLAERTRLPPELLRSDHTLSGLADRWFPATRATTKIPWVLPQGCPPVRRPAMQFCPWCLDQSVHYYQRIWRMSLFTVCPDHFVCLHHACPQCSAEVDPIRSDMRYFHGTKPLCWQCGFDLRRTAARLADADDAAIAYDYYMAIISEGEKTPWPAGMSSRDHFAGLSLVCAALLTRAPRLQVWRANAAKEAGVALPAPDFRHAATAFDTLADPASRRAVLRTARWLLADWPQRFVVQARAADTRTSDFARKFVTAPPWFLEPLNTHLTPPRRKPTPTPGLLRVRRMHDFILARRRLWYPKRQHKLARALQIADFYSPETDVGVILRSLPNTIARLRAERADYHLRMTRQVERGTPQWSRLLLKAGPYRKDHCANQERLRKGIALLCEGQWLSGRDLSDLLRRSQSALVCRHLIPMSQQGQLEARFPTNEGGRCRANPRQAYRLASGQAHEPQPKRSACVVKCENICSIEHGGCDPQTADGGPSQGA